MLQQIIESHYRTAGKGQNRCLKDYATLGKQKSLLYVSGVLGRAYNPTIDEDPSGSPGDVWRGNRRDNMRVLREIGRWKH